MNWKLLALGKESSCDRKRPVVFWTFHTFVCIANQPWAATKKSSREKIQGNVWKVQNTTGRFLSQLHPSNFVLKILFLVPIVSNSWIFQKRCFMKIIWHRISIQTLLFQACLPTRQNGVENRDKAYSAMSIFLCRNGEIKIAPKLQSRTKSLSRTDTCIA